MSDVLCMIHLSCVNHPPILAAVCVGGGGARALGAYGQHALPHRVHYLGLVVHSVAHIPRVGHAASIKRCGWVGP